MLYYTVLTNKNLLFSIFYNVDRVPECPLTLKAPNKNVADDILIFYFYLSKKISINGLIFHVNPLPSRGFT